MQPPMQPFTPFVAIIDRPIDITQVMAQVEDAGVGAISLFIGTVREHNEGRAVTGIDYEAYQPMAEHELRRIAEETCAASDGLRVAVVHRVGTLKVGEASVVIATAHARRAPAMLGAQRVIEVLKQRVPIWKREHYVDGDRRWVDPTAVASSAAV